jgi:hypothetical protein
MKWIELFKNRIGKKKSYYYKKDIYMIFINSVKLLIDNKIL